MERLEAAQRHKGRKVDHKSTAWITHDLNRVLTFVYFSLYSFCCFKVIIATLVLVQHGTHQRAD